MRRLKTLIAVISLIVVVSSCYTQRHPHGHLPPGKAKKIYGDKSAKRHAPGQKKKYKKKGHKGKGHYKYNIFAQ